MSSVFDMRWEWRAPEAPVEEHKLKEEEGEEEGGGK